MYSTPNCLQTFGIFGFLDVPGIFFFARGIARRSYWVVWAVSHGRGPRPETIELSIAFDDHAGVGPLLKKKRRDEVMMVDRVIHWDNISTNANCPADLRRRASHSEPPRPARAAQHANGQGRNRRRAAPVGSSLRGTQP
jgi:hypothetical protein